jgi:archaellum component FlaF (FlaF/FlaG flagellin family)
VCIPTQLTDVQWHSEHILTKHIFYAVRVVSKESVSVTVTTKTQAKRKGNHGCVLFNAVHIKSKKSSKLLLPRTSCNIILPSMLMPYSGLFPSGFLTKIFYALLISHK